MSSSFAFFFLYILNVIIFTLLIFTFTVNWVVGNTDVLCSGARIGGCNLQSQDSEKLYYFLVCQKLFEAQDREF